MLPACLEVDISALRQCRMELDWEVKGETYSVSKMYL